MAASSARIKLCCPDCCLSKLRSIFLAAGMEKGIKQNQDQSSMILPLEHNLRHNAVVLKVMLKSIVLKFSNMAGYLYSYIECSKCGFYQLPFLKVVVNSFSYSQFPLLWTPSGPRCMPVIAKVRNSRVGEKRCWGVTNNNIINNINYVR